MSETHISKKLILADFVQSYESVEQHSVKWLDLMKTTVGGSEIAALLGRNPYKSFAQVVVSKLDLIDGKKMIITNIDMWWGTLFENVIKEYVEIILNCKIVGDKICITTPDGYIRCSPDGYTVLPSGDTIMFEFKCPSKRIPVKGVIPNMYVPQVLLGLSLTPFIDYGIFCDAIFRRCAWENLGFNSYYNHKYHFKDLTANLGDSVLAWGVVGIYAPIGFNKLTSSYTVYDEVIDCGKINDTLFFQVMEQIYDTKKLIASPRYLCLKGNPSLDDVKSMYVSNTPNEYYLFGLLPFKLFMIEMVNINSEENFLNIAIEQSKLLRIEVTKRLSTRKSIITDEDYDDILS
jgi:putative phage-type endonuclease